jgi:transcriptional regulator with XRE-family HTH domain
MTTQYANSAEAPIDWVIGQNLARARKAAGLSREALASMLRIENGELAAIEAGRNRPDPELLLELCCILNVRLWSVFRRGTLH